MPLYEYSCAKCGKRIEVLQSFSAKPPTRHAECGGKLEKLISRSGFVLKGSGWYQTDYKSGSSAPSSSDSGDGGTDSDKPAAKDDAPADKPAAKEPAAKEPARKGKARKK